MNIMMFLYLPSVDASVSVIMVGVVGGLVGTVSTVTPGSLSTVVEVRFVVVSSHRVLLASDTHCDMCVPLEMQSTNMKPTEKQQIITDAQSFRISVVTKSIFHHVLTHHR